MGHFLILYGEGFVSENEAADLFRHGEVPIDCIDRRPDRSLKDGIGFQGRFVISNVIDLGPFSRPFRIGRSEEHTSELQSLMRISYAVFCLKKKKKKQSTNSTTLETSHVNIIQYIVSGSLQVYVNR